MTVPADPREALRLMREFAQHQWDCIFAADLSGVHGDEWAGDNARPCNCGFDKALALYDEALAARQDEPSPALRLDVERLGAAIVDHRITFWATEPCDAKCAPDIANRYDRAQTREETP